MTAAGRGERRLRGRPEMIRSKLTSHLTLIMINIPAPRRHSPSQSRHYRHVPHLSVSQSRHVPHPSVSRAPEVTGDGATFRRETVATRGLSVASETGSVATLTEEVREMQVLITYADQMRGGINTGGSEQVHQTSPGCRGEMRAGRQRGTCSGSSGPGSEA